MDYSEQINYLMAHPEELIKKKPFVRGVKTIVETSNDGTVMVGEAVTASLPTDEFIPISQSRFRKELDPACHDVLFDDNIPSITAKTNDGSFVELKFKKMAVPFQKMIMQKHVLHLCGYDIQFTLDNKDATEQQLKDFATFKQYWKKRNMGGMRTKMVAAQKSYGDAGLLFYFDRHGDVKAKLISYGDGYVICSHNDSNGDRLVESVYYRSDDCEYIDSYTDDRFYRHVKKVYDNENSGWELVVNGAKHGFNEIPLVTKRGNVAWNDVQDTIEVYEIIYNIFLVIQKRHGWGILYIKGNFNEKARKLAGAIVLNDSSLNKDGKAEYLTPPTPQGMLDTLKLMEETIQKGSGTTFILPKDISTSGDISGVAIEVTQSLDNEEALGGVIEWQNVASKMERLFLTGLATELVRKRIDKTARTRFAELEITSTFKQWRPRNDAEYNQMLATLKNSGLLSSKTGIEKNTESTPDEERRVSIEVEELERKEAEKAEAEARAKAQASNSNSTVKED